MDLPSAPDSQEDPCASTASGTLSNTHTTVRILSSNWTAPTQTGLQKRETSNGSADASTPSLIRIISANWTPSPTKSLEDAPGRKSSEDSQRGDRCNGPANASPPSAVRSICSTLTPSPMKSPAGILGSSDSECFGEEVKCNHATRTSVFPNAKDGILCEKQSSPVRPVNLELSALTEDQYDGCPEVVENLEERESTLEAQNSVRIVSTSRTMMLGKATAPNRFEVDAEDADISPTPDPPLSPMRVNANHLTVGAGPFPDCKLGLRDGKDEGGSDLKRVLLEAWKASRSLSKRLSPASDGYNVLSSDNLNPPPFTDAMQEAADFYGKGSRGSDVEMINAFNPFDVDEDSISAGSTPQRYFVGEPFSKPMQEASESYSRSRGCETIRDFSSFTECGESIDKRERKTVSDFNPFTAHVDSIAKRDSETMSDINPCPVKEESVFAKKGDERIINFNPVPVDDDSIYKKRGETMSHFNPFPVDEEPVCNGKTDRIRDFNAFPVAGESICSEEGEAGSMEDYSLEEDSLFHRAQQLSLRLVKKVRRSASRTFNFDRQIGFAEGDGNVHQLEEATPQSQLVSILDKLSTARQDKHRIDFLVHASTSIDERISREERHITKTVNWCLMCQAIFLTTFAFGCHDDYSSNQVAGLIKFIVSALGFLHLVVTLRDNLAVSKSSLHHLSVMKKSVDDEVEGCCLDGSMCSSPYLAKKVFETRTSSKATDSVDFLPLNKGGAYEAVLYVALLSWIIVWGGMITAQQSSYLEEEVIHNHDTFLTSNLFGGRQ